MITAAHASAPVHRAVPESDSGPGLGRWAARACAWAFIAACLAVLAAAVVIPRVAGATPWAVLSSSMEPSLPTGTLVVTKPVSDPSDVGIGSVITYQLASGDPTVVTHRVVEVRSTMDGEISFRTQGDANSVPDAEWVRPVQIRGVLWYAVPHLGHAYGLVSNAQRTLVINLVAIGLLGYAVVMFAQQGLGLRRRRRSTS